MEPFKVFWQILLLSSLALASSSMTDDNSTTTLATTTPPPDDGHCNVTNALITVRNNQSCTLDLKDLVKKEWHRLKYRAFKNCKEGDLIIIDLYGRNGKRTEEWKCKKDEGEATDWFQHGVPVSIQAWGTSTEVILEIQSYPNMQWTYVVIRILIGILFMMIPIFVIFYFFFRRQAARNRLLLEEHIAQRRYSISVISHEDPRYAFDKPPMYEDIYDDEPPPCFCKVVTIAGESNAEEVAEEATSNASFACHCEKSPSEEPSVGIPTQQGDDKAL